MLKFFSLLYLFFSHILLIFLKLLSHKNDKRNALDCKYIPCFLIVVYENAHRCLSKCYDLKVNHKDGEEFLDIHRRQGSARSVFLYLAPKAAVIKCVVDLTFMFL
jgi:hypothetical protein